MGREVQQPDDTTIDKALNEMKNLSDQIRYFWQKTKLTELDTRLRFFVTSLVEGIRKRNSMEKMNKSLFIEAFGSIFRETVCLPFGSSVNTFGKSRCDLDMLLTFEDFRGINVFNSLFSSRSIDQTLAFCLDKT